MPKRVLIWDAPNIDMTFSQLLGHRPGPGERPDLRALLRWLVARRRAGETTEACVLVNIPRDRPSALQGWIGFLTGIAFRVFAKPKLDVASDIDAEMVGHLRAAAGDAVEVIVGSNDARCFLEPLREVAERGVDVTVLGFTELAGELAEPPDRIAFVDLADIPGFVQVELRRIRLDTLPDAGAWFDPRVSPDEAGLEEAPEPSEGPSEPTGSY